MQQKNITTKENDDVVGLGGKWDNMDTTWVYGILFKNVSSQCATLKVVEHKKVKSKNK